MVVVVLIKFDGLNIIFTFFHKSSIFGEFPLFKEKKATDGWVGSQKLWEVALLFDHRLKVVQMFPVVFCAFAYVFVGKMNEDYYGRGGRGRVGGLPRREATTAVAVMAVTATIHTLADRD